MLQPRQIRTCVACMTVRNPHYILQHEITFYLTNKCQTSEARMAMSANLPSFIKFITRNKTSERHAAQFVSSSQQSLSWSGNSPSFINPKARYLETPNQSAVLFYLHRLARSCCTYNVRVRSCVRWSQSNVITKHLASLGPALCFHCCVHHVLVQGRRGQANNLALHHTDIL